MSLGRKRFLLTAMLSTIFILNSCRKDLLVQSPDNLKNALSIAEARSYFEANIKAKYNGKGKTALENEAITVEGFLANKIPVWEQATKN